MVGAEASPISHLFRIGSKFSGLSEAETYFASRHADSRERCQNDVRYYCCMHVCRYVEELLNQKAYMSVSWHFQERSERSDNRGGCRRFSCVVFPLPCVRVASGRVLGSTRMLNCGVIIFPYWIPYIPVFRPRNMQRCARMYALGDTQVEFGMIG